MAYESRFTGQIDVTPALTYPQFRSSPFYLGNGFDQDVRFHVVTDQKDTDEGPLMRRTVTAIVPAARRMSGHRVVEQLQQLVDAYPGHEFTGLFEVLGEDDSHAYRIIVDDRRVIEVRPLVAWPVEADQTFDVLLYTAETLVADGDVDPAVMLNGMLALLRQGAGPADMIATVLAQQPGNPALAGAPASFSEDLLAMWEPEDIALSLHAVLDNLQERNTDAYQGWTIRSLIRWLDLIGITPVKMNASHGNMSSRTSRGILREDLDRVTQAATKRIAGFLNDVAKAWDQEADDMGIWNLLARMVQHNPIAYGAWERGDLIEALESAGLPPEELDAPDEPLRLGIRLESVTRAAERAAAAGKLLALSEAYEGGLLRQDEFDRESADAERRLTGRS